MLGAGVDLHVTRMYFHWHCQRLYVLIYWPLFAGLLCVLHPFLVEFAVNTTLTRWHAWFPGCCQSPRCGFMLLSMMMLVLYAFAQLCRIAWLVFVSMPCMLLRGQVCVLQVLLVWWQVPKCAPARA
jgi:hypothetical protein